MNRITHTQNSFYSSSYGHILSTLENLHDIVNSTGINKVTFELFSSLIFDYYHEFGRSFSWRETYEPYKITISEIMLQQTQTDRVIEKYNNWCLVFPDIYALANAPFSEVLLHWQGLGYNRRALYIHIIAKEIVDRFDGIMPQDPAILEKFKGIGPNTARSICAFAFNQPVTFIETNIRTVFIQCFFHHHYQVDDKEIITLITKTLDQNNPREWYYALIDFGVFLKKIYPNSNLKSKHHTTQTIFEGSDRQIRGAILRLLLKQKIAEIQEISKKFNEKPERINRIIETLIQDNLIIKKNGQISLPK